jgi:CRISPR-associated exonuclease Cas4
VIRLKDEASRARALTDLDATLLVEAAAGTGKTAILAGRVILLLASGRVQPANIAAITFTEFAAGELRERITRFLNALLAGQTPKELELGFPAGPSEPQLEALQAARARLDELTCTTIHGFCHVLLRAYSVEAGVDPGAEILDRDQAELAFSSIFDAWLRRRLDRADAGSDAVAVVAQDNPIKAEALLRAFAKFRRDRRSARTPRSTLKRSADAAFVDCVDDFRRWFASAGGTRNAVEEVEAFETLAAHFRGEFEEFPPFDRLWRLARPPRVQIMNKDRRRERFDLKPFAKRGVWRRSGGAANGERLADEAEAHYDRCAQAFRLLLGEVATAIAEVFCAELDELLAAFTRFRRNAAVLDFDDLLYVAREVLTAHKEVRAAASTRFARILVDEFQDTDRIQAEIIFLLTSDNATAETPWHERALVPGRLFAVGDPKQAIYRFRGADLGVYLRARASVERQFPGNVVRMTSNFRSRPKIIRHVNDCLRSPLGEQSMGYVSLEGTREDSDVELPCVARIKVEAIPGSKVKDIRDAEAQVVAEACARMIGNVALRRSDGTLKPIALGDVALLAPVGADLWRYERALEEVGLPFSSQAGKNLFRRQEVQDLVALVRALADPRDRLALGALLRGPVVGLTEQELLDIVVALPREGDRLHGLSLYTDPVHVPHALARETLVILRDLRQRVRSTSPLRAVLVARGADQASRALANLDAVLDARERLE